MCLNMAVGRNEEFGKQYRHHHLRVPVYVLLRGCKYNLLGCNIVLSES